MLPYWLDDYSPGVTVGREVLGDNSGYEGRRARIHTPYTAAELSVPVNQAAS